MANNPGTTLPGGYRNALGGPADVWYAQTDGTPYASVADACAAVPTAYRRTRTVNVAGVEYQWVADLSDAGLLPKAGDSSTPSTAAGAAVPRSLTTARYQVELPAAVVAAGIGSLKYELIPRVGPPPTSYSDTLSATKTQVDGITADIGGTQKMKVNTIVGAGGNNLILQLIDSSDSNRLCQFGFVSDYAGGFYQFQKADSSFYEMPWPSTDKTITV